MSEISGYLLPDDLYYHKEHMWVRLEGNIATVGVTDFYQKLAGEISYIELPSEGDEVSADDVVGTVETGKWVGKIYAPLSGIIKEINTEIEDDPTLPNQDPFGKGWLFKIEASNLEEEIVNLYKGEEAIKWQEEEIEKHKQ
jgi:glycine cleavage system H protein